MGKLDALIVDFPPGTSDEPLTVSQHLPGIDGVVIVTTPQEVALLDSRKSINFAKTISVPVLGVVENMSGYMIRGKSEPNSKVSLIGPEGISIDCISDDEGNWSTTLDIFKKGGGLSAAEELSVPYLGSLPFDPGIVREEMMAFIGSLLSLKENTAQAFNIIVDNITNSLNEDTTPSLKIT